MAVFGMALYGQKPSSARVDSVNTASRLESSVAKPGMIVVGENTHAAAAELFQFRALGSAVLKGKEKEVAVFEVLGLLTPGESTAPRSAALEQQ